MTASPVLKNWRNWALTDTITIKLFSTLRRFARGGKTEFELTWQPRMQARDILETLKIPDTAERVLLVNGRYSEADTKIQPRDTIVLFPPMTGG
jgi:molybdopterin converting factor small subunit